MAKNFGLGRGLGSLIPNQFKEKQDQLNNSLNNVTVEHHTADLKDVNTHNTGQINQIKEVAISQIVVADWQPRQNFDENALAELADSIIEHGILEPLIVTPVGGDKYRLIAGERRFRAAQMANLTSVPVLIKPVSDQEHLEISLIENIQRSDLNPIEEAMAYQKLINDFNLTQEQVSKKVGKSRSQIANYLRILKLPQEVINLLISGKISMGHAKLILEIKQPIKQIQLAKKISENYLSVKATARKIKIKKASSFDFVTNKLKEIQAELSDFLKTKVKIKPKGSSGGGIIEIEYYSDEDLDSLREKFK